MQSVLSEVAKLREGIFPAVDGRNRNRYCLIAAEDDGSRTAYCFGVPIYNVQTRKLISLRFDNQNQSSRLIGSNATINITDYVRLENGEGYCDISLPDIIVQRTEKTIYCRRSEIFPTLNGLMFKMFCSPGHSVQVTLRPQHSFMETRANDKYFSLMSEAFHPFVTVSAIGTADVGGTIVSPCTISYQTTAEKEFIVNIQSGSPYGSYVLYEVNLHEQKLFQDTTVESAHPEENNAFGGTAFIGNTFAFGEQWLYSRPDLSKISELRDRVILKSVLYIPKHAPSRAELSAFRVVSRFCSFGSNWNNKIGSGSAITDSSTAGGYHSLDITALLTDVKTKFMTGSEGLILKTKVKDSGFTAIATGDSYYAPQILAINFR